MNTINEQEFKRLCDEVIADAPTILEDIPDAERQSVMKHELHTRLCQHLGISRVSQEAQETMTTSDPYGNSILVLLGRRMRPSFDTTQALRYFVSLM